MATSPSESSAHGPDDLQMAVIVAAVEMAWPRPVVVAPAENEPTPWRWSGRWWGPSHNAVPASRRRPWA
jgi:hypothetical protein